MHAAEKTAEARLATRKRVARHSRINALIDAASKLLPQALEERWANRESRADWCESLLQKARRALQGPEILVALSRDWERNERDAFLQKIQDYFGQRPKARADSGLVAGLRIHSGNAWLDGSITGLLAQQGRIKADLAALLTEAGSDPTAETGMAEAAHG